MFEAVHVDEDEEQQQQQQGQSGSNDTGNGEEQSLQTGASIGEEGVAASEPEGANNNDSSAETSRRRTTTGLWRNLFGANATLSRSDDTAAAANAINNEGNTLEEPLLPDV
eukprot:scaffold1531_cov230-Skeletonema_marinoi.AAC.2